MAGGALVTGLTLLLALNIVNPEAVVVRHDVGRAVRVDPAYLVELSDDAVPELARTLPRLGEEDLRTGGGLRRRAFALRRLGCDLARSGYEGRRAVA